MKLLHISYHFEFDDAVEALLARHGVRDYVRYPRVHGMGSDGKRDGTRIHPGNFSVVQALVPDDGVAPLVEDLRAFRDASHAQEHLRALVLAIEQSV